jgi:hypothetical protein
MTTRESLEKIENARIAIKVGIKRVVEEEGPTNGDRWATSMPPVSKGWPLE